MNSNDTHPVAALPAVSDLTLRHIAENGFFGSGGSLAAARAACAELLFARSVIAAQTAKLNQQGGQ